MPLKVRHIAVIITGIFLFPVFYQPWHFAEHHGHRAHDHATSHSCDHAHHHVDHASEDQTSGETESAVIHSFEHCFICDYEFAVKGLPGAVQMDLDPVQYRELRAVEVFSRYENAISLQVRPRAPPVA